MHITLTHAGVDHVNASAASLAQAGVPAAVIGAAVKAAGVERIKHLADEIRTAIDPASAARIAEYRIKEEIARDPASADAAELAAFDREGEARGLSRADHIADVLAAAGALRIALLTIAALDKEARAVIASVADDAPGAEAQVEAAVAAAATALVAITA